MTASIEFELKSKQGEFGNALVRLQGESFEKVFRGLKKARETWQTSVDALPPSPTTSSRGRKPAAEKQAAPATNEPAQAAAAKASEQEPATAPEPVTPAAAPEAKPEPSPAAESEPAPAQQKTGVAKAADTRRRKNELNQQAVTWAERLQAMFPEHWGEKNFSDVMQFYNGGDIVIAGQMSENGWNKLITGMRFAASNFIKESKDPDRVAAVQGFMAFVQVIDEAQDLDDFARKKKEVMESGILDEVASEQDGKRVYPTMWDRLLKEAGEKKKALEVAAALPVATA